MSFIFCSKPVLVTGATGYVAGWIVKKLLDEGITVHAAVRDPNNNKKMQHLIDAAEVAGTDIKFFKTDLLEMGSYNASMQGCELVYHTASPFAMDVDDPIKQLIEPAKLGTRNVLEEANNVESVKRVVITSSCVAIFGDNIDLQSTPNNVFTEEIWNTSSSTDHQAYSYSKTLAEKEAWEIVSKQSRWNLVVVNPSFVLGPALNPSSNTSESFSVVKQMGDGSLKSGTAKLGVGIVDVRDLAFAHFQAGYIPGAEGRHIISGHNSSFIEMAKVLIPKFGDKYPIPRKEVPKFMIWLLGPMINKTLTRKYVSRNVGYPFIADNSKSKKALGMTYRSLDETMNDMFQQMIDNDLL